MKTIILICVLVLLACPSQAATAATVAPAKQPAAKAAPAANGQVLLGTFGGWRAYSFKENGNTVCYMSVDGPKPDVKTFKRGTPRLTITHRPGDNSKDVFSYTGGYVFKSGSSVTARIGKLEFDLFTDKDTAWARDAATDRALAATIKTSGKLTASGQPEAKNAKTINDAFDLTGGLKAYQAIGKACGYAEDVPKAATPKAKSAQVKPVPAKH